MNRLTIIGNLVADPELRSTPDGTQVCNFTVAVNRRKKKDGTQEADFFRVTAWRELAASCGKFLAKGRKVAVVGPVSVSTYTTKDGRTGATLEVQAHDVEFCSPKDAQEQPKVDAQTGYQQVDEDFPF